MLQLYATVVALWTAAGHRLKERSNQETGASAVEYAVILAIAFAVATLIGFTINAVVNNRVQGIN